MPGSPEFCIKDLGVLRISGSSDSELYKIRILNKQFGQCLSEPYQCDVVEILHQRLRDRPPHLLQLLLDWRHDLLVVVLHVDASLPEDDGRGGPLLAGDEGVVGSVGGGGGGEATLLHHAVVGHNLVAVLGVVQSGRVVGEGGDLGDGFVPGQHLLGQGAGPGQGGAGQSRQRQDLTRGGVVCLERCGGQGYHAQLTLVQGWSRLGNISLLWKHKER